MILNRGPVRYIPIFRDVIFVLSLVSSFIASPIGCDRPWATTLVGPLRKWARPIILRSMSVKNATPSKTPTQDNKKSIINIVVGGGVFWC